MSSLGEMLVPGRVLAEKYRIDRIIGRGGMGIVIAATHVHLNHRVALKVQLPETQTQPGAQARFLREARAVAQLRSEHVARVLDVGTLEGVAAYIVMEFLQGADVCEHLAKHGPLPIPEAVDLVLQASEGLAEAHALGIVHRDLKTANLFLTARPDGAPLVKLLDFGISKIPPLAHEQGPVTLTNTVMGSPTYMSPEQLRSTKTVDARADIWSLGVVLHELLTGRCPFEADSMADLIALILHHPP